MDSRLYFTISRLLMLLLPRAQSRRRSQRSPSHQIMLRMYFFLSAAPSYPSFSLSSSHMSSSSAPQDLLIIPSTPSPPPSSASVSLDSPVTPPVTTTSSATSASTASTSVNASANSSATTTTNSSAAPSFSSPLLDPFVHQPSQSTESKASAMVLSLLRV